MENILNFYKKVPDDVLLNMLVNVNTSPRLTRELIRIVNTYISHTDKATILEIIEVGNNIPIVLFREIKNNYLDYSETFITNEMDIKIFDQICVKYLVDAIHNFMPILQDSMQNTIILNEEDKHKAQQFADMFTRQGGINSDIVQARTTNAYTLYTLHMLKTFFNAKEITQATIDLDFLYYKYSINHYVRSNTLLSSMNAESKESIGVSQQFDRTAISSFSGTSTITTAIEPSLQIGRINTSSASFGNTTNLLNSSNISSATNTSTHRNHDLERSFSTYTQEEIANLPRREDRRHMDQIKNMIIQTVYSDHSNLDILIEPIYYQMGGTSLFIVRYIDALLHGPCSTYELIDLCNRIHLRDQTLLLKIFNDRRVTFEHHRQYLHGTTHIGATMSSILVEGHVDLYTRILDLVPNIRVNVFDDLSILFNYIISGNIRVDDRPNRRDGIISTIQFIKNQEPLNNIFTKQWFEKVKNLLQHIHRRVSNLSHFTSDKFADYIGRLERQQFGDDVCNLFYRHNGWESSSWHDEYNNMFIPETKAQLNVVVFDEIINTYFNFDDQVEQSGQAGGYINGHVSKLKENIIIKSLDDQEQQIYKKKYLKYKAKYLYYKQL